MWGEELVKPGIVNKLYPKLGLRKEGIYIRGDSVLERYDRKGERFVVVWKSKRQMVKRGREKRK